MRREVLPAYLVASLAFACVRRSISTRMNAFWKLTWQAELARAAGAVAVSAPMGGEPEIAEVALIRYVIAAMDLVDLHEVGDTHHESARVRHLSVVSA